MAAPSQTAAASSDEARAYTLQAIAPQAFGKYVLVGKLGHGGMAEVNLAVTGGKGGFRKLFVIKRLHAHLEAEPGFVDMFLDEARLAAQLDHPHCVQTVEVGEVNGQHFLCMEYLDGQGLERLLRMAAARNEAIPPAIAARIALDALDGIGYAHELTGFDGQPLGVVHRDISPQNLFVTYTGVVKVLDFGIAKAASNVVETRTGVIKGKYAYIAPEQALASPIDARADLWSMGVVLWEMLTTRRLFKSVNELATLQETLRGEIKPPSAFEPSVPKDLDDICMRALQRDPDQRYKTAGHFKADLEAWLITQPNPPDRRAISALMKERFEPIAQVQKQKLRECLEAVAEGKTASLEKLIEAGGALASTEISAVPQPAGLLPMPQAAQHGPYPTPTPYPSNPYASAYPSQPYVTPSPQPWGAMTPSGPPGTMGADEKTYKLPPKAKKKDDKGRPIGLWLVAASALLLAGVIGAVFFGRTTGSGDDVSVVRVLPSTPPGTAPGTVSPGAVSPVPVPSEPVAPAEATPTTVATPAEATSPPSAEGGTEVSAGRRHRPSRGERDPAPDPEPAVVAPPDPGPAPSAEVGYLALVTSPWTNVTCGGQSLGTTPIARVSLPPGHYSCRLSNPDEGIQESYELDIRAGETTRVRLGLR